MTSAMFGQQVLKEPVVPSSFCQENSKRGIVIGMAGECNTCSAKCKKSSLFLYRITHTNFNIPVSCGFFEPHFLLPISILSRIIMKLPMELPTFSELQETFDFMLEQQHNGVSGVIKIESETPEPSVGITTMTHGNEPSGLSAIWYFMRNNRLQKLLDANRKGSVIFSVNNIHAAQDYFRLPRSATTVQKERCRSLEVNMNRLSEDILKRKTDSRVEIQRTLELCEKIFYELDGGLDIHSVRKKSEPILVSVKGRGVGAARKFPINIALSNMIPVQIGYPISSCYGGLQSEVPVVGIEAGQHESVDASKYAIHCTRCYLQALGLICCENGEDDELSRFITEYKIARGVVPPEDKSFRMSREFGMFEKVNPEDILLKSIDGAKEIQAGMNGCVLMAKPVSEPLSYEEEACFLSEPARYVERKSLGKPLS